MEKEMHSGVSDDPGGARFGNFINYYQFNPAEERISHLPENFLTELFPSGGQILALDVGCNAGDLTLALHGKYKTNTHKLKILGIDLDPMLILRAKESLKSTNERDTSDSDNNAAESGQQKLDSEGDVNETDKHSVTVAEHNKAEVEFLCADVMTDDGTSLVNKFLESQGADKFDIIFVFSVSMWIHLHHGDSGLNRFLETCSKISRYTLLEPQPWRCYQTARRRMKRLQLAEFPKFSEIKLHGDKLEPGILNMASDHGMRVVKRFGETKWKRKLILLQSADHQDSDTE